MSRSQQGGPSQIEVRWRRSRAAAAWVLPLWLGASAAPAERLPLARGGWIETVGPWRIEGRLVVYRSAEGNLRSIRFAETALAAESAMRAGAAAGTAVLEYPRGRAVSIPPPEPLPAPSPPPLRRPAGSPAPASCVLANGRPGDAPEVVCVERSEPPRAAASPPSGQPEDSIR